MSRRSAASSPTCPPRSTCAPGRPPKPILAGKAAGYRPDELAKYAQRIMDWLHPDGEFSDAERARKRGIMLGKQEFDGMSRLSGLVTPELRAALEAMLAKLAAPGACNPDDETPVVDATPDEDAVRRDHRSQAQRNHDGLLAGLRGLFASGELGQHNGLPVSIIVTTTLKDLEAAAGKGLTGGGTLVPMSDVIRWASHAHHYLAIFDRRQTPGAVSHETSGVPRAANHAVRQGTWLHQARLRRTRLPQPSPPRHKAGRPPAAPTSTTSPWPADPTTDSPKKAGPPAKTPKATPNGYRRRTWITGNPASTPIHHPEKLLTPDDDEPV